MTAADRRLLCAAAIVFIAFCGVAMLAAFTTNAMVDITSGVWLSLAVDFSSGVLYRPLVSDAGVGGTRYFPLVFVLHGLLIRAGIPPLAAGHAIQLLAALAVVWAAWGILRGTGAPPAVARALAALTLCSTPALFALTTIRGDLVPVALNMVGLRFVLQASQQNRRTAASILMFSLAALAKPTAVYAVLATAAAFALNGGRRRAALLAGGTLAIVSGSLVLVDAASGGEMLESFRACAAMGMDWSTVRRAPLSAAAGLIRQDPVSTLLLVLTAVAFLNLHREEWREPTTCVTLGCVAMVVMVYASPGVDFNHLIDVFVIATVFVGRQITRRPDFGATAAKALAAAVVLSLVAFYLDLRHSTAGPEFVGRTEAAGFVSELPRNGRLFSDNGVVPAALGERNFVLDGFLLGALRAHRVEFEPAIAAAVADRRFRAVVLMSNDPGHFAMLYGAAFPALLRENYDLVQQFAAFRVYRPKTSR